MNLSLKDENPGRKYEYKLLELSDTRLKGFEVSTSWGYRSPSPEVWLDNGKLTVRIRKVKEQGGDKNG